MCHQPGAFSTSEAILKVIDGVSGALGNGALGRNASEYEYKLALGPLYLTLLVLDVAEMSFWRKFSQSLSGEASSTTISRLSSDSLKMMYLYFLLSLRSLNAVMHSCETEALQGWHCQLRSSEFAVRISNVGGAAHDCSGDRVRGAVQK